MRRSAVFTIATLLLVPVLLLRAQGTPPPAPLTLISREGRRAVPTVIQSGQELIALDDVAALFQVMVAEDAGGVTVSYRGRTIVLSAEQSIASVNGRIVTLPGPITRAGRRVMVPIEFLSRALGPIYDRRIDLRRASRLLIVGDMNIPRVVARIDAVGPPTRAIIEVTPPAPVTVASENGRAIVRIDADALDLTLPAGGGLIEQIRAGDQPNTVTLVLGGGAGTPRTATITSDGAARVMIDVPAAPVPGGDTTAATPPAPPPPTDTLPVGTPRARFALIAIDPGHGGADAGVKTGDGLEEKELTLDVARRVRQRLETRLGVRAILTRDEDKALTLDERAAFANNSKADLFLSLHANGALGPGVTGAEVYFLSLDREGETVRRTATADAVSLPVLGGGRRLVEVVPWNLAQAAYIDKSAKLAGMLEEELRRRVPMSSRAVQSAGMRVLTGANMPAALVEMAYLTNRDQAVKARGEEFRNAIADAVYEAVARFRAAAIEKPTP